MNDPEIAEAMERLRRTVRDVQEGERRLRVLGSAMSPEELARHLRARRFVRKMRVSSEEAYRELERRGLD